MQHQFDYVIWRSLRNAPPVEETLDTLICFLANEQVEQLPRTQNEKILQLLHYLRHSRCLLILDDLQSVLDSGDSTGHYRSGCEGYGQLLRFIVSTQHQSTIVVTSWDKPKGLTLYEEDQVRFLVLRGLEQSALQEIFHDRIRSEAQQWQTLLERYAYNPNS